MTHSKYRIKKWKREQLAHAHQRQQNNARKQKLEDSWKSRLTEMDSVISKTDTAYAFPALRLKLPRTIITSQQKQGVSNSPRVGGGRSPRTKRPHSVASTKSPRMWTPTNMNQQRPNTTTPTSPRYNMVDEETEGYLSTIASQFDDAVRYGVSAWKGKPKQNHHKHIEGKDYTLENVVMQRTMKQLQQDVNTAKESTIMNLLHDSIIDSEHLKEMTSTHGETLQEFHSSLKSHMAPDTTEPKNVGGPKFGVASQTVAIERAKKQPKSDWKPPLVLRSKSHKMVADEDEGQKTKPGKLTEKPPTPLTPFRPESRERPPTPPPVEDSPFFPD
eukprot:TRINITY_DN59843_c0_g1_i1.p1 TRINITY_DN59843_c0_g1~~TRINITY_DN59843_c0_g1_i1.p1  ORF type:complete len:330 (-),score=24.86 TRINITY_DN59843_c0_g1_i1:57-1046(-)